MDICESGSIFNLRFDKYGKSWETPYKVKDKYGLGLTMPENFDIDTAIQLLGLLFIFIYNFIFF